MSKELFCTKYQKNLPGLDFAPLPGEAGLKILNHISQKAWKDWIAHQTILINEYRLSMLDPKAKSFLAEEREKFLFGEGSEKPDAFIPKN